MSCLNPDSPFEVKVTRGIAVIGVDCVQLMLRGFSEIELIVNERRELAKENLALNKRVKEAVDKSVCLLLELGMVERSDKYVKGLYEQEHKKNIDLLKENSELSEEVVAMQDHIQVLLARIRGSGIQSEEEINIPA